MVVRLMTNIKGGMVQINDKLESVLEFVCKVLGVKKEDFISLALINLLEEELDWIKYTDEIRVDSEELEIHQEDLNKFKTEANLQVLK